MYYKNVLLTSDNRNNIRGIHLRFCQTEVYFTCKCYLSSALHDKYKTNIFTSFKCWKLISECIYSHWEKNNKSFLLCVQLIKINISHVYSGQASILMTLTCSPAHRLAPTSHSVIVVATVPTPELAHKGVESVGHSDAFWHTHFDSGIEK